jgi:hypothetical protein
MALAIAVWAGTETLKLLGPRADRGARALWTAGAVLAIAHAAAAFHLVHGWSHDEAYASTARQTANLTGLDWGGGLFVNYAFLALWAADAAWWWARPSSYRRRPRVVEWAMRGFFLFMFINGAIVFAHGAMRAFGTLAVGAVIVAWYRSIGGGRL